MRYLFRNLDKIKLLLANRVIFLFLDYDGTLVPISNKPALAIMSERARNLLCALSRNPRCRIAVISGRPLNELARLVALDNLIYAGNHGLELKGPQIRFTSPVSPEQKQIIKEMGRELRAKLAPVKGVLVENKMLSLSVHYRLVPKRKIPLVKTIFCRATVFPLWRNQIRVHTGKMVLEVRPSVKWDKGRAVLWFLRNVPFRDNAPVTPIYIGDDRTDEDAFKALKDSGLTVFVGAPGKSAAQYYLNNPNDVLAFLSWLVKTTSACSAPSAVKRRQNP